MSPGESLLRQGPNISQLSTNVQSQSIVTSSPSISSFVGDNIRVVVVLDSGAQVIVPISNAATSEQLRLEAVRRAVALNVPCSAGNSTLRVCGYNGPIIFGEDRVLDVLDLAQNHTFYLGPLEMPPYAAVSFYLALNESTVLISPLLACRLTLHPLIFLHLILPRPL
jgi:hypothetical protein